MKVAIGDKEAEALQKSKISLSDLISIDSTKIDNKKEKPTSGFDKSIKKRGDDKHSSRSNKKRRA
ncbi:unnamed protein product [Arabidopsis lyrata]|nr:unnamed protein product [Arabidopsis lyrata]